MDPKKVTNDKDEQYVAEELLKVFGLKSDSLEKINFGGGLGFGGITNASITFAVPASDKAKFEENFFAFREKASLDKKTLPLFDKGHTEKEDKTPENYYYTVEMDRFEFKSRETFDSFLDKLKVAKSKVVPVAKDEPTAGKSAKEPKGDTKGVSEPSKSVEEVVKYLKSVSEYEVKEQSDIFGYNGPLGGGKVENMVVIKTGSPQVADAMADALVEIRKKAGLSKDELPINISESRVQIKSESIIQYDKKHGEGAFTKALKTVESDLKETLKTKKTSAVSPKEANRDIMLVQNESPDFNSIQLPSTPANGGARGKTVLGA